MDWHNIAAQVTQHVVKVKTPNGIGTGLVLSQNAGVVLVATAAHVVRDAYAWQ